MEEFRHFAARAHEAMGVEIVEARFLEFADPKILDIIERYVQQGATQVTLLPFFWCRPAIKRTTCPARYI